MPGPKAVDITGMKFGKLTVIKLFDVKYYTNNKQERWLCKCDCGKNSIKYKNDITNGECKQCGSCAKKEANKSKDITGMKFGKLTVIELFEIKNLNNRRVEFWLCKCDCGKKCVKYKNQLTSGIVKSCGCWTREKFDITGRKFNRLTVMKHHHISKSRKTCWLCKCDCGKEIIVETCNLKSGGTKSCGCYNIERFSKLNYNPLLTDEERLKKGRDKRIKQWRREIYKRDNYSCCLCGRKRERFFGIVAHHIYSYGKNKELRFDLNNGSTLCQKCHDEFHKNYGYKNNTKKQWDEFGLLKKSGVLSNQGKE
jgi:5-methylcytosine-specific restriction endonuclease McrA